jgi:hypothetical protein
MPVPDPRAAKTSKRRSHTPNSDAQVTRLSPCDSIRFTRPFPAVFSRNIGLTAPAFGKHRPSGLFSSAISRHVSLPHALLVGGHFHAGHLQAIDDCRNANTVRYFSQHVVREPTTTPDDSQETSLDGPTSSRGPLSGPLAIYRRSPPHDDAIFRSRPTSEVPSDRVCAPLERSTRRSPDPFVAHTSGGRRVNSSRRKHGRHPAGADPTPLHLLPRRGALSPLR